jgi:uncharacterized membrane protein
MNISDKVKEYLNKKLHECQQKLFKLKRRRKIIKSLYIITMLLSIITSAIVTVISTMTIVPVIVITLLSTFSTILTAISSQFNFHNKKADIKTLIEKLNRIICKLDYVVSCNGDLTHDEYQQILKDF